MKSKFTVSDLDAGDAEAVGVLQDLLEKSQLRADLTFIKAHFAHFPPIIIQLQSRALTAPAAWSLFAQAVGPSSTFLWKNFQRKSMTY